MTLVQFLYFYGSQSLVVNKVRSEASIFITFMTHYVFNMTSFAGSESGVRFRNS